MNAVPDTLQTLVDRFDASVLDATDHAARIRLVVEGHGRWDVLASRGGAQIVAPSRRPEPDATLVATRDTWDHVVADVRGGIEAHRAGRLVIRRNLHVGVGFLAATSGATHASRLRFERVSTVSGKVSILTAGTGDPVLLIHGLGATKSSFLSSVAALAGSFRTIALDLPGFGDSFKPLNAPYHAPFFARAVVELMDALGLDRAHVIGNSMGGRVALELGLRYPERVGRLALLAPSLAWKRERRWAPLVRLMSPHLGLVQVTPRWGAEAIVQRIVPAEHGWVRAGVEEFLRAYLTPRGRVAFYAAARQIYLEEPHGAKGFWTRLAGLAPPALFVWGRHDSLVPIGFAAHVKRALPSADHLELGCGHVPQVERPAETHAAVRAFFDGTLAADRSARDSMR
ncbi:MAG TPA: alpha/beta fold hydrolase [Candidatus Binatia bacterium]|jgi:pimeloyl-ACP methyl ester carboxylesterase